MWKDPAFKGRPSKIMIISVDKDPLTRQAFEDYFVEQLKAHGTEGVASYTILSYKHQEDPDAIMAQVLQLGADGVLITRLLSKEIAKGGTSVEATSTKWQDYYGYDKRTMYPPGIIAEDGYIVLETKMYKAANIEMVWSVTTKTAIGGSFQQRINSYIDNMVQTMVEQGLLVR